MTTDDTQSARWNGPDGKAWIENRSAIDQLYKPIDDLLVAAIVANSGQRVLDVGCGTGATTVAIARHLGKAGSCVGVDISGPMVAEARARADRNQVAATFVLADAQEYAFPLGQFDMVVSRFGVMFFADPERAFVNLRTAVAPGGSLRCVVWRAITENPFMTTAERAAAPLVPTLPRRHLDRQGPFAFANPNVIHKALDNSWAGVAVLPIDVECRMPERELLGFATRVGPLGRIFANLEARTQERVVDVVRRAFDWCVYGKEVRFTAACWMIAAHA